MPQVALKGSSVQGMTSGEHSGHIEENSHGPCTLTGTIVEGTPKMKVQGVEVAYQACRVTEDDCCAPGTGALGAHTHKIRVAGLWVQLQGDTTVPHNGTARITTGTPKVHCVV